MSKSFAPMLAVAAELDKLRFPLLASAKLDGIRAIVINGVVMSRKLKPIPNLHVQKLFGHLEGFDGELIVGDPTSKTVYNDTMSGVMSVDGEPDVWFFVFDTILKPDFPYGVRAPQRRSKDKRAVMLAHHYVSNLDQLLDLEERLLDEGYEGLILRHPEGRYKFGRSTVNEGLLLKLKRFEDAEAVVVDFEERMHNGNEATTDALGRTKRSSHRANKSGRGDLGALVVERDGIRFNIGTGFDDALREKIWMDRAAYLGKLVKFKFFPVGVKEAPRHPVFLGWRDEIDT